MDEKLVNRVLQSCDRAEIRGEELDRVLLWFNKAAVYASMLGLFEKGLTEIAGSENGEPNFEITEAGKQVVEKIEKSNA